MQFHVLDVFAESALAGNQLAVVEDAAHLPTATLQAIAREFNFSETTFTGTFTGPDEPVPVRIFTPTAELPFAGHPTVGTAWHLRRRHAPEADRLTLALGVGPVSVSFEADVAWMAPEVPQLEPVADAAGAAAVAGLAAGDLGGAACIADAGIRFLMLPVRDADALARARLDGERLAAFAGEPLGVYLFTADTGESADWDARMFFVADGPREDPATGSATACLAAWLREYAPQGGVIRVTQGVLLGRPSHLYLRLDRLGAERVEVGGRVVAFASGEIAI